MGAVKARSATVRLAVIYAVSFAALGGFVPYMALELQAAGVTGLWLAVAMGALPLGRLVGGPLWSAAADRFQAADWVLRVAAVVALVGMVGVAARPGHWVVLAVLVLAVGRAPLGPVLDTLSLRVLEGDQGAYGRLRRWGSVGFLLSTLAAGALADHLGLSPLWYAAVLSAILVLAMVGVPRADRLSPAPIWAGLKLLFKDAALGWLMLAAAFHFAAHVGTTSFLAVHMESMGARTTWTGVALALGVGVEVGVMSLGQRLFARFDARQVFLFAVVLALPRWILTAMAREPWVLVALQGLHGITFGAFWLAGVSLVAQRAPKTVANSAQAALGAAVGGLGAGMGMAGGGLIVSSAPTWHLFLWGAGGAVLAILCTLLALRAWERR